MTQRARPMVLVVDDEPANLQLIADLLESEGYMLTFANNGRSAIEAARTALPTLILLDIGMPDIDGIQVCRELKQLSSTRDIPIIFVTSHEHEVLNAFKAGGVDYIRKPVHAAELRARVHVHMRIVQLIDQLAFSNQKLSEANTELARLSFTDALTGIANRRHFDGVLETEWRRGMRGELPLSVLLIDVDHFKRVNDEFGHQVGDEVLREVGRLLRGHAQRGADLAARYGGEEFVLVLPNTAADSALAQAERLREAVEQLDLSALLPNPRRLTISIGVASAVPTSETASASLLQRADQALYQAKQNGRNRVAQAA